VLVQVLRPKAAIEGLDKGIVGWLPRAREVEDHPALVGPKVDVARDELAALTDTGRLRVASRPANAVERHHHIFTTVALTHVEHGHITGEGIDHGQDPQFLVGCQLVVHKMHRPDIVWTSGYGTVISPASASPSAWVSCA
jgi:hypothetical protein